MDERTKSGSGLIDRDLASDRSELSRADFSSLVEGLPGGVYKITTDRQLIGFNGMLKQLFGVEPDEQISQDQAAAFLAARKSAMAVSRSGDEYVREFELTRFDGSTMWVLDHSRHARNSDGQVMTEQGILQMIPPLKIPGRALVVSERNHRMLVEMAGNGILVANGEHRIVLFNEEAEGIFGYRSEEIIGEHLEKLIPERLRPDHAGDMASFSGSRDMGRKDSQGSQLIGLRKNGDEIPLEISVSRQKIDGESLFTAIVRDITDVDLTRVALRKSETRLRSMFELSRAAILIFDYSYLESWFDDLIERGVVDLDRYLDEHPGELEALMSRLLVVEANQAAADIYEASSVEAMSGPLRTASFTGIEVGAFREQFMGIWEGRDHIELDTQARSWKGSELSLLLHCVVPTRSGTRDLSQVMVMITDVGRHQALVDELRENQARAEEALAELAEAQRELLQAQKLESIGSLAAGIAHEINTPAQYVADNTRFLQEMFRQVLSLSEATNAFAIAAESHGGLREELASYRLAVEDSEMDFLLGEVPLAIEQSLEGIEQISSIVRALKDFSHPGSQAMSPVDMNSVLESTITVSRSEWKYVADLSSDLDPDLPLISGFSGRLNQVFLNLIVNAAHAIGEAKNDSPDTSAAISVKSRRVDDHVEISISDTGCGIPDEILDRLFDPFFTTKEVGKGTGQGLSIARAVVVEQHGGRLEVSSELGQGSTFTVCLPVLQSLDKNIDRIA